MPTKLAAALVTAVVLATTAPVAHAAAPVNASGVAPAIPLISTNAPERLGVPDARPSTPAPRRVRVGAL